MHAISWLVRVPALAVFGFFSILLCHPGFGQTSAWQRQYGTPNIDRGLGVAADPSGNVLVMGMSEGPFEGEPPTTQFWFLRKLDPHGKTLWTKRYSDLTPISPSLASDSSGGIYLLEGFTSNLTGLDSSGNELWTTPLGAALLPSGLSTNTPGAIYATGWLTAVGDSVISKVDPTGSILWQKQFGGAGHDETTGIASDLAGNVYASGFTTSSLDGPLAGDDDAFVTKYDTSGTELWTRQLGTALRDVFNDVAVDGLGNAYLVGATETSFEGETHLGARDAILTKYDSDGNLEWVRQFGTSSHDEAHEVAVDSLGNIYVIGETQGNLMGPSAGFLDMMLSKFDPDGNLLWHYQVGSTASDVGLGIDVDPVGNLLYTGYTLGDFAGPSAGSYDVIVGKIAVPEPATLLIAGILLGGIGTWRRHCRR